MRKVPKNITHEIKYHFLFCSRYRRKVLINEVAVHFRKLLYVISKDFGWELLEINIQPDYCHLYLKALPYDRPQDIMARIKSYTSRHLRSHFDHLSHLESLWTRAYFVSTSPYITDIEVQNFLSKQKSRG